MKADRRWWNDGRLDRVCRAWSELERPHESPHQLVYGLTPRPVDPEAERVKAEMVAVEKRLLFEAYRRWFIRGSL